MRIAALVIVLVSAALVLAQQAPVAPTPTVRLVADDPATVRGAVEKAIPHLWAAMEGHNEKRSCFACHHHGVSLLAIGTARSRGFAISQEKLQAQIDYIVEDLERNKPRFDKGMGPGPSPAGGETDNTGYMLLALASVGYKPDDYTAAVVEYTLKREPARNHWATRGRRAPTEASSFTTTALCIRGVQAFHTPAQKQRQQNRVQTTQAWLIQTQAQDNEDRVFRLLGMKAAGVEAGEIQEATLELLATQRADGGWAQTDRLASDAYATGTALYALHIAGGVATTDEAWRKGVRFLLGTQATDGTWYVKTRSNPIQKYYESGFPYGKDQFISCAATGWATAALALATPKKQD